MFLALFLKRFLLFSLLMMGSLCRADQPTLIGVVTLAFGAPPVGEGLAQGLRDLGFNDYDDFIIGYRFTSGDPEALPGAVRELLADGVSILVTVGVQPTIAAANVTTDIPIVFTSVHDPVALGLIKTFSLPGGNITGIASLDKELDASRLQKFRQLAPDMKTLLLVYSKNETHTNERLAKLRSQALKNGIQLIEQEVSDKRHAEAVLASVTASSYDGLLSLDSPEFNMPGYVLEAANRERIPAMFNASSYVDYGGFASYGTSFIDVGKQAARLAAKIMHGQNPESIPVEADQNIEFVINLGTAKKYGITVAPDVLFQATRVVR